MEKKRKWEMDYENYANSTELDERIAYLQYAVKGQNGERNATKEEYKELKRLTALKTNLPKVKNILELRTKLEEENKAIKDEISRRETFGKLDKVVEALENQMAKLEEEKEKLENQSKNKALSKEEKEGILQKLKDNEKARQENNVKFGKCQDRYKELSSNDDKYKDVSLEELKSTTHENSIKISKCNLACNKLMQGYSWDSVEVALDKFKETKFKATAEQSKKIEENKKAVKAEKAKETVETIVENNEENKENEENSLIVQEEKTSVWSKIKSFFGKIKDKLNKSFEEDYEDELEDEIEEYEEEKSIFSKIKDIYNKFVEKITEEDEEELEEENEPVKDEIVEEKVVEEKEPEPVKEEKKSKEDDFRKYLREIAEKGIDGIEQDKNPDIEKQKNEARKNAMKKLIENKKNARGDDGGTIKALENKLSEMEDER